MTFVLFLAWGFCIGLACAGFGKVALKIIRVNHTGAWVLAPGVGLGVVVFTGAVLNLLGEVKRPIVIADIAVGVALLLLSLVSERKHIPAICGQMKRLWPQGWLAKAGLLFIGLILVVRMGVCVQTNRDGFQVYDDLQAYLAYPVKMLATGSFASDPFSERRIVTSLGGITYLEAAAIAPSGDLRITNLVDGSIGLGLMLLFAVALCRRLRLSANQSLWVLAVLALTPDMRVNTTSIVLPAALLLLLVLIYLDPRLGDRLSWRRLLLFGVVAGTACTLKSTAMPAMGLFTIFLLGLELWRSSLSKVLRATLTIAAVVLAVLLPWMIDSKAKCHTLLYPLLGRGYHVSAYMHVATAGGLPAWLISAPVLSLPFVLTAIALFRLPSDEHASERQVAVAAVLTAAMLPVAIGFLVQQGVVRYSITTLWAVNVLVVAFLLAGATGSQKMARYTCMLFTGFSLLFALVPHPGTVSKTPQLDWFRQLKAELLHGGERMPEAALVDEDRKMQQSIPVGATLLVRTDESYGYNFQRNVIWIADYPGSASLPPGVPLNGDAEALDRYFLGNSIRYIAYSYADEARIPHTLCMQYASPRGDWLQPLTAREFKMACILQGDFAQLSKTHRHVFDDGRNYVLDLENQ